MSTGGKGSKRRPQQVPDEQVKDAWDRIFLPPPVPGCFPRDPSQAAGRLV